MAKLVIICDLGSADINLMLFAFISHIRTIVYCSELLSIYVKCFNVTGHESLYFNFSVIQWSFLNGNVLHTYLFKTCIETEIS